MLLVFFNANDDLMIESLVAVLVLNLNSDQSVRAAKSTTEMMVRSGRCQLF